MERITPIGISTYQNKHKQFGIKQHDRTGHIYCLGKTGTGKSTLLLNMAIHDIQTGKGIGIIDPHGDLAQELLAYIPKNRIKDVVYLNAKDTEYPVAFNPLYKIAKENRYFVAASIVTALKKLWLDSWGPRLEHILRHAILSLVSSPHNTLLDITPMLTDSVFRRQVLFGVSDSSIHEFWQKEFEPLSPQLKSEIIAPILNKVGLFTTHPLLRNILGQTQSSFDVLNLMDQGKIFIANLSKGVLGEAGTQLLGSLLITQFQVASLQRSKYPVNGRKPFHLYVDEMHSFMTLSFVDILSESRKYGLCLFLTHQFTDQLDEEILTSILGNIGTIIIFRLGINDALKLKDEFFPVFNETDLINIPRHHIYIKLLIDGTTSQPFSAITHPVSSTKQYTDSEVINWSRNKHSFPRDVAETHLLARRSKGEESNRQTLF